MYMLTSNEIDQVDGGLCWGAIGVGLGTIALGVAIVGTAGLATVPLASLVAGDALIASTGIVAAGSGGAAIGYGLCCRCF